jgi:hypothetical protein
MTFMAQKPLRDAYDIDKMRNFGPGDWLAGPDKDRHALTNDLIALCVAKPDN